MVTTTAAIATWVLRIKLDLHACMARAWLAELPLQPQIIFLIATYKDIVSKAAFPLGKTLILEL